MVWGQDRYRIRALERVLSSGSLEPEERAAALRTLLEKIDIYANGARRRGRTAEAARYLEKRHRWLAADEAVAS